MGSSSYCYPTTSATTVSRPSPALETIASFDTSPALETIPALETNFRLSLRETTSHRALREIWLQSNYLDAFKLRSQV